LEIDLAVSGTCGGGGGGGGGGIDGCFDEDGVPEA